MLPADSPDVQHLDGAEALFRAERPQMLLGYREAVRACGVIKLVTIDLRSERDAFIADEGA